MLTKDLLRVSRSGGGFRPRFADDEALAGRVIGVYQGHVGEARADLREALTDLEREAEDFKLVRGYAKLLEREAAFETRSAVDPARAREAAFAAAEDVGVVTEDERTEALARAADDLEMESDPDAVADALYADREARQVLAAFDSPWGPADLVAQYNLSLAQTALFDAVEVRVRSDDPRSLVSAVKRLGLLYEIRKTGEDREVVLTGPDALFRHTRRYGTRFARLLRAVARAGEWRLEADVDDRGTVRTMVLSDDDPVVVPDAEPVAEVSYDSEVERDFATRFASLDLDWDLVREPAPLDAGDRVMIPDFAFDYRPADGAEGTDGAGGAGEAGGTEGAGSDGTSPDAGGAPADYRVYFEVMGFWTPEYVEKKLEQLDAVDGVEMLVAADESLGVGEEVAARDHRVVTYSGRIRVKDVVDELRRHEASLVAESAADLPDALRPEADVVGLDELAAARGVAAAAVEDKAFPEHERVGRTLVRPAVLDDLRGELAPGMSLDEAEDALAARGLSDASAALAALGYRVDWEGLGGGTLREK